MSGKIIVITGVSSGLGRALAEEALKNGYVVAGTVRDAKAGEAFEALAPERASAHILDVTNFDAIPSVVQTIEETVGPIYALVNNAGYGLEGPVEESSMSEIRRQFEVNVYGALAVTQAVLPYMRKRRSGRILNVTSMGGLVTFPGVGIYNASKFALEGVTEALRKELNQFGILVTAIEPGMFRTDWAGRSMIRAPRVISDYDESFDQQRAARQQRSGQQAGDPVKAANAMLRILNEPNPPGHLLLGPDAVKYVTEKLESLQDEIRTWKDLSMSTDFD